MGTNPNLSRVDSKDFNVKKFFYASSSSVYGDSSNFPLKETGLKMTDEDERR